eukprot:m51a1_g13395 hypothetical protein (128) ;mRNA; r:1492-2036
MGFMLGALTARFSPGAVLVAAGITVCISGALAMYAWVSPTDFSFLAGAVVVLVFAVIPLAILMRVAPWPWAHTLYAGIGVLMFSILILVDVSRMKSRAASGDWMSASISLYMDVVNMFMCVLYGTNR